MSTAALCGMNGTLTGTSALEVAAWEINLTNDAPDATSFESNGWKERVPCLIGANGTFKSIGQSSTVGLHAGCNFTTGGGGSTISGDIIISRITIGTPVDGIVTFDHEFVFTGCPSFT